jgi:Tfp pilus assembly protein PilF
MNTASTQPPPRRSLPPWLAGVVLALAVIATWSTSLPAPFVLDDHDSIVTNATIRRFPSLDWLRPPATGGETVSGRPVVNLTFAIDQALHGLEPRGYRLTNVLVHAAAALALLGIVRRTLLRVGRSDAAAGWTALAVALIWALHPLQTAAVTYIVQRAEALAALFGLLTLYGFIRASEHEGAESRARAADVASNKRGAAGTRVWFAGSVIACWLGIGAKETAVAVPIVVLLYDRAFVSGSMRAAWRRHGGVHAALFASWIPLAALVIATGGRGDSAGFEAGISSGIYFLTQCEAVVRYVRLAFWPAGLVFDHGVPTAASVSEVWMQLTLLLATAAVVGWALVRNRAAGFLGACFFVLLAPSSSVVPIATQTVAEHRMYLPLAAIVALAAGGATTGRRARGVRVVLAAWAIVAAAAATVARNGVYRSEVGLWSDTAQKRPDNARAHYNLGRAWHEAGDVAAAEAAFRQAIALQPEHVMAHFGLGTILADRGESDEALQHLRTAVTIDAHHVGVRVQLGVLLLQRGRDADARAQLEAALREDPAAHDARAALATIAAKEGRLEDAERWLLEVVREAPELAAARYQLGLLREKQGDRNAAERELRMALRYDPGLAAAQLALGNLLARAGDVAAAEAAYREAARLAPRSAETHFAWGNLLARSRRIDEAIAAFRAALEIDPAHVPARNNLANALLVSGRFEEAVREYEAVLQRQPENATVRENLQRARELRQRAGR